MAILLVPLPIASLMLHRTVKHFCAIRAFRRTQFAAHRAIILLHTVHAVLLLLLSLHCWHFARQTEIDLRVRDELIKKIFTFLSSSALSAVRSPVDFVIPEMRTQCPANYNWPTSGGNYVDRWNWIRALAETLSLYCGILVSFVLFLPLFRASPSRRQSVHSLNLNFTGNLQNITRVSTE